MNSVKYIAQPLSTLLFVFIIVLFFMVNCLYCIASSTQDLLNAEQFVQKTADSVLAVIKSEVSDGEKSTQLENIFLQTVSAEWMAKFALAKNVRSLSKIDKEKYMLAYKKFLLKSYVPRFRNYNGQHFKIVSSKELSNSQFVVTTEIVDPNTSNKIMVAYRCKIFSSGKIKVIDIIAENVSLMASQRSEFSAIIENEGISSLIERLTKHTTDHLVN